MTLADRPMDSCCQSSSLSVIPRSLLVACSASPSWGHSERIAMPLPDDAATPVIPSPRDSRPAPLSRRSVLRGAAGAGAAGLAVTALGAGPAFAASQHVHTAKPASEDVPDHIADGEAVVVHVRNV